LTRQVAASTGRTLKDAKPADLPVQGRHGAQSRRTADAACPRRRFLEKLSRTNPRLFVHWQIGMIGTFA
jgi:hypothetical protein